MYLVGTCIQEQKDVIKEAQYYIHGLGDKIFLQGGPNNVSRYIAELTALASPMIIIIMDYGPKMY